MSDAIQPIDEYLYVWKKPAFSEPGVTQDTYVIGMEKTPGERDSEYITKITSNQTEIKKVFKDMRLTTQFPTDHTIHKYLKQYCKDKFTWDGKKGQGALNTQESFTIKDPYTEKDLLETLSTLLTKHPDSYMRVNDFELRKYQEERVEECKNIFSTHESCALQLPPRAGKSYISLEVARQLGKENILILTPMPMAKGSFIKIARTHKKFTGWTYTDNNDVKSNTKYAPKLNICLISFQKFEDTKQSIDNMCKKVDFDFIIIDEAHHTSDTLRSKEILDSFKGIKKLYMSGTFYNDFYSGRFSENEIINHDFIEFIKYDKEMIQKNVKQEIINLPDLAVYNVSNMNDLQAGMSQIAKDKGWAKLAEYITKYDCFDFDAIFSSEDNIATFFDFALPKLRCVDGINKSSWFEDKYKDHNILMFVPSLDAVDRIKNIINIYTNENSNSILAGYHVEYISDRNGAPITEDDCNRIMDENPKTLFISVDKMTTGITLPKLDTIFLMKNISSTERFVQILFRMMTPLVDEKGNRIKTDVRLYNFNSQTTIDVVSSYIAICSNTHAKNQCKEEAIKELFECIAFNEITNDGLKCDSISAAEMLAKTSEIPINYSPMRIFDFDDTNNILNQAKYKNFLSSFDIKIDKKALNIVTIGNKRSKPKKAAKKSQKTASSNNAQKTPDLYAKIMQILSHLDYEILGNKVTEFKDLKKIKLTYWDKKDQKFKDYDTQIQNIVQDIFEVNKIEVSNFIYNINYNIINRPIETIYNLSLLDKTDRPTPKILIEKMFNKFSFGLLQLLKSGKGIILDPCCGSGAMLLYLHYVVGIPKDNLYGIDLYQKNVNICNILGFKNVVQGDATKPLKSYWKNMTNDFDAIIMNPPYDSNTHLKILKNVIKEFPNAEIVNLSPIRWLVDPLAEYKQNSVYKNYKDVRNHIESIDIIERHDTNSLFGITCETLGIYKLSKEGKGVDIRHNKAFADKILAKTTTSLQTYIKNNVEGTGEFKLPIAKLHWTSGDDDWAPFTLKLSEKGKYAASGWTQYLHDTYEVLYFKTEAERDNCKAYLDCKVFKYILGQMFVGKRLPIQYVPFMDDYTHSWTDEDLYKYFDLTEDEIKEIESTVQ